MKNRLILATQNKQDDDFALTPYLFLVNVNINKNSTDYNWLSNNIIIKGVGICWGRSSLSLSIGLNLPDDYITNKIIKLK